jgi:hypothetical protein
MDLQTHTDLPVAPTPTDRGQEGRGVLVDDDPRSRDARLSPAKIRLGEELPIFCEKCGYALHGLPQHRCGACDLLQFHCPECGHHQPINTLRPAAQKLLGRIRAVLLVLGVFFKINFFGWLLVAWVAMGVNFSYSYDWSAANAQRMAARNAGGGQFQRAYNSGYSKVPQHLDWEEMLAFSMFGLAFGMVGRMLLLRWRRGHRVGGVLAVLAGLAVALGATIEGAGQNVSRHPFTREFNLCIASAAVTVALGASIVWGIWVALVTVFLPRRTGQALLEWQANLSNRPVSELARQ